jgi:hypothetical protein
MEKQVWLRRKNITMGSMSLKKAHFLSYRIMNTKPIDEVSSRSE